MKSIVVIPTYNERDNVSPLIKAIHALVPETDILICDDSSSDGTGEIVERIAKADSRVFLLVGPQKGGLGPAYVRGFTWALDRGYEQIGQMDCDFSHDPKVLPLLFGALDNHDLAIGSRYVFGGGTINWPWYRRLISRGGTLYASTILQVPLADLTGSFKAWRASSLRAVNLSTIISNGYSFSIEMNYRAYKKGLRILQIPIIFEDRRVGQTKMSREIFWEAVWSVWKYRFDKNFR
jgi:dolichol-phosphate mannosyltransferase